MKDLITPLLILLLILLIFTNTGIDNFLSLSTKKHVYSHVDNESYYVCSEFPNTQEAADNLAKLNTMNVEFIRYVRSTRGKVSPVMRAKIDALLKRYNPQVMLENTPHNSDSPRTTSYTTNKGENMYICLRSLENSSIENLEILKFVVLHELAHVATDAWGHDTSFWVSFKWVLQQAAAAGIYKPVNYGVTPIRYCGMDVNYNPYFDKGVPSLS
jgi:hypothetical protein